MKRDNFIGGIYCISLIEDNKVVETNQFNIGSAAKLYLLNLLHRTFKDKQFDMAMVDSIAEEGKYIAKRFNEVKKGYLTSRIEFNTISFI